MGNTKTQGDNTEVENNAAAEEAFAAGFSEDEYELPKEADQQTPSDTSVKDAPVDEDDKPVESKTDDAAEVEVAEGDEVTEGGDAPEVDEWEGVSDAIKKRFESMSSELSRVTNIANSASGRANKLQSQLQQSLSKPAEAPKPTSQQILDALADKAKRDALRDEWPDFAETFDELDTTISTAVGSQIDALRAEFAAQQEQQAASQVKYVLDMRHPGWENTVVDEGFKSWVYDGGPTSDERTEYENVLSYAQSLSNNSPSEAKKLFGQANEIYNSMLSKYPDWADDRGKLYGDPSGDAAIKLLDMHKAVQVPEVQNSSGTVDRSISQQERNKQRLAANVAPTSGGNRPVVNEVTDDLEAAFEAGFNS
jgi:hypothetical protein